MAIHPRWGTTGFEFDGHRIVGYRGVVRGIRVRSRNLIVNLGATIQTLFAVRRQHHALHRALRAGAAGGVRSDA
jgi:uncharacterized protein YbjQ (UPF0145 family)